MATTNSAFYGGGHRTRSAYDFAYHCLRQTTTYYTPKDVFIPPRSTLSERYEFSTIANCAGLSGAPIPLMYGELTQYVDAERCWSTPQIAIRKRGALLLSQGAVLVSLGDGQRVIYEKGYQLVLQYIQKDQEVSELFEYGAFVPGLEYP